MSPAHDLIERLYGEHHLAVTRFTRARARDRDLVDDVVSETFAIALRRADAIPAGAERAWLCGVADNVLRNAHRKEARAAQLPGALEPLARTTTPPHEPPAVGPAIGALPDTERAVLTLTAFEGLSSGEAAERLGLSPGSTRNAMVRARRNLAIQLAGLVVLLLVPVLYLLLRDRSPLGEQAPQAQQLADTLDRALSMRTDATVTSRGSRERYGVQVDRAARTQRITLPDGRVAVGPIGGELRIVPQAGDTAQQRRAEARDRAPALAALQTITSGDLERFLAQAKRASVRQRTTGAGTDQVTVIEGPFTTHDGREVELRVRLRGEPAELAQLKVRRAGDPTSPWVTVDISSWRLRLPGAPEAQGSAPGSGSAGSSVAARPRSDAQSDWDRDDGDDRGKDDGRVRGDADTPSAPAPADSPSAGRKVPSQEAARNRAAVAALPPYTGETGAVRHTRSRTVSYRVSGSPRESRANTVESETWLEVGGGQRFRSVDRSYTPRSGRFVEERETWRTPRLWAIVPRKSADGTFSAPSLAFACQMLGAEPGMGPDDEALTAARQRLDSLPAGRRVGGQATRQVDVRHPNLPATVTGPQSRWLLHAESGVPLQRTWFDVRTGKVASRTTYSLWEEQPAGGPAGELAASIPDEFHLHRRASCDPAPPPPAAAPTTP